MASQTKMALQTKMASQTKTSKNKRNAVNKRTSKVKKIMVEQKQLGGEKLGEGGYGCVVLFLLLCKFF